MLMSECLAETEVKTSKIMSKSSYWHVARESSYTTSCKTTFSIPGLVHKNPVKYARNLFPCIKRLNLDTFLWLEFQIKFNTFEPGHEKTCLMSYANNEGADQPAHPRSLSGAFVVRCLDSIISLDSIAKISSLQLAPVAAQACLCLVWSETPEDTFCHDEAHLYILMSWLITKTIKNKPLVF